jgi:AraC-like DNA-binding protein
LKHLLQRVPEHAITLDFAVPGRSLNFQDGWIHKKTAPCTIIAQATQGRYEVESGGKSEITETGGAFLAMNDQWLTITHHADKPGGIMKARWLHARFLLYGSIDFVRLLSLPRIISQKQTEPFGVIIEELFSLHNSEGSLQSLARRNELGFRALAHLCEIAPASQLAPALLSGADRLLPVLSFIRDHLAEPLKIQQLAKAGGISRSRLHALFIAHFQLSPMDYAKKQRIAQASRRLLLTDAPVYTIAEQTGFANPYHFSREFKKSTGIPPLAYRKRHCDMKV